MTDHSPRVTVRIKRGHTTIAERRRLLREIIVMYSQLSPEDRNTVMQLVLQIEILLEDQLNSQ